MKEAPSFLRSRHNFAGKNTFVNKSISIPKISGSMLASNQPKKLVILKENEVKKLKEEEKLRQLELKEEKKRKRQSKRSSSRKRKSKNKTDNEHQHSDVSNSDIDYKSNKEEEGTEIEDNDDDDIIIIEPTTPKRNPKSLPTSPIDIIDNDNDDNNDSLKKSNTESNPPIQLLNSPTIISSPGSPMSPMTTLPTLDEVDLISYSPPRISPTIASPQLNGKLITTYLLLLIIMMI